jgi:hypothetical protein
MILARAVFQAKFGKANELVAAFKEMNNGMTAAQMESVQPRILTDISGPFDTVVVETTHENLAALEQFRAALFASMAEDPEGQSRATGLVESGRNEYYTIES